MLTEQRTSRVPCKHKKTTTSQNTQKAKAQIWHRFPDIPREKQSRAGFLWKRVEHLEAADEDNLKPTFKGWGGGGSGNLTLSPQVSRFSQTRLRLWGAWEDQTGRTKEKKKMWIVHFLLQWIKRHRRETTTEKKTEKYKEMEDFFTSSEDSWQKKINSDECSDCDSKLKPTV